MSPRSSQDHIDFFFNGTLFLITKFNSWYNYN